MSHGTIGIAEAVAGQHRAVTPSAASGDTENQLRRQLRLKRWVSTKPTPGFLLATRNGSTADTKARLEKVGVSRNPTARSAPGTI